MYSHEGIWDNARVRVGQLKTGKRDREILKYGEGISLVDPAPGNAVPSSSLLNLLLKIAYDPGRRPG